MLIFLDIDGVMVPANSWKRPEFLSDNFPEFSNRATNALHKIICETNADIVLTTSHKSKYSINQWLDIFNLRKINITKIDRLPENTNYLNRKEEIFSWLLQNKISNNFIIIDDDKSLNSLPTNFKNRLILTSGSLGLTDELADEAILILKNSVLA